MSEEMEEIKEIKEIKEKEISQDELIKHAIINLVAAASSFERAGFRKTADSLLNFSSEALEQLDKIMNSNNLDESKLSDSEYDTILNEILNG